MPHRLTAPQPGFVKRGSKTHAAMLMLRFFGRPVDRRELRAMNPAMFTHPVDVFRRAVLHGLVGVQDGAWYLTEKGHRALVLVRCNHPGDPDEEG